MIHYMTTNGIGNPWVAAELEILERSGVPFRLHVMRKPATHFFASPWAKQLNDMSDVLYPLSAGAMIADVLAAPLRFGSRFFAVLFNAFFGERESFRVRLASIAHVFVAAHWAAALRRRTDPVTLIHSQWIHSCGTIAMYAAWLLDVPFTFTGHAADLFRERAALRDKVRRAEFIICISSFHRDLYRQLGASDQKLHNVFCGIDVKQFAFRPRSLVGEIPVILSVGRLVEKKGFEYLIDACAMLKGRGLPHRCVIAGDGPLEASLRDRIARHCVGDVVELTGKAILQEDLPDFLAKGHIFAQPCVWAADGDVDGTPRTLMEAMACGNAAVSTKLVGIPDIVEDGVSGLLVKPRDAWELADALQNLLEHPDLVDRFARAGRERMERLFQIDQCVAALVSLFLARLKSAGQSPLRAGAQA